MLEFFSDELLGRKPKSVDTKKRKIDDSTNKPKKKARRLQKKGKEEETIEELEIEDELNKLDTDTSTIFDKWSKLEQQNPEKGDQEKPEQPAEPQEEEEADEELYENEIVQEVYEDNEDEFNEAGGEEEPTY